METKRSNKLQELCRGYLCKLKYMAKKHGLGEWLDNIIKANSNHECEATEKEVQMLSRLCDDERVQRKDIPNILEKSYRECFDNDDFDKIKKLKHVGIYSKVSAILFKTKLKDK